MTAVSAKLQCPPIPYLAFTLPNHSVHPASLALTQVCASERA